MNLMEYLSSVVTSQSSNFVIDYHTVLFLNSAETKLPLSHFKVEMDLETKLMKTLHTFEKTLGADVANCQS